MVNSMGIFVEYDDYDLLRLFKVVRFRVDLLFNKRLRRGMRIMAGEGSVWVNFKYERFPDIYFIYGMFCHLYKGCFFYDDDVSESEFS